MSWVWHKQFKAFRFRVTFTYTTSVDVTSAKCYMYLVPMALTWNVTVDISTNNSLEKDNNFYIYLLRARTRLHLQKKSCRVNVFLYSCSYNGNNKGLLSFSIIKISENDFDNVVETCKIVCLYWGKAFYKENQLSGAELLILQSVMFRSRKNKYSFVLNIHSFCNTMCVFQQ